MDFRSMPLRENIIAPYVLFSMYKEPSRWEGIPSGYMVRLI